jgi:hypothetical protein
VATRVAILCLRYACMVIGRDSPVGGCVARTALGTSRNMGRENWRSRARPFRETVAMTAGACRCPGMIIHRGRGFERSVGRPDHVAVAAGVIGHRCHCVRTDPCSRFAGCNRPIMATRIAIRRRCYPSMVITACHP